MADVRAELERASKDATVPAGYVRGLAWALRQDPVSAAVDGSSPVATGDVAEAQSLRAEVAKLQAILDLKQASYATLEKAYGEAQTRIDVLNIEIEQKDAYIESLKRKEKTQ
jgi:hypothetical protein